ncbi:putative histone H1-like [Scophthalmus maximus]|uniref:Putative histone H1-like n=1 Tax=Scophthalmus maximus TaxID=52904 RepID=A0A2U9CK56_SCOMX|nr:putative histone H1-like [Scophthalmus maximus]KAF0044763.1 hypothetical protein F2P81_003921 [Scophthalmus maximus]
MVAKAAKKKAVRPKKVGPSVTELIIRAVSSSKERSGVSAATLRKALAAGGYHVKKNKARVNTAIKSLVAKRTLVQTKGTGASGYFKINKKAKPRAKKLVKKAARKAKKHTAKKRTAAKKPKSVAAKKRAGAKKSQKKVKKAAAGKKQPRTPRRPRRAPRKL